MTTPADIRKAIDELLPSEQEDMLRYLTKRIDAAHKAEPAQRLAFEGKWLAEDESDLQYVIPEAFYQSANPERQEDD